LAVYVHQSKAEREYVLPEGARRLRMEKPLGIVFEEVADDKGAIVVQVTILLKPPSLSPSHPEEKSLEQQETKRGEGRCDDNSSMAAP